MTLAVKVNCQHLEFFMVWPPHSASSMQRITHFSHTLHTYTQCARSSVSDEYFHFHFWSWRDMRITHVATVAPPKWAEVAVHHTRPASTNTQLSSAASCLLNDCCFLLFINAAVLATVGELGDVAFRS